MDWETVQKQKKKLRRSVAKDLGRDELELLVWLLEEERRYRFGLPRGSKGIPNQLRRRIETLIDERLSADRAAQSSGDGT